MRSRTPPLFWPLVWLATCLLLAVQTVRLTHVNRQLNRALAVIARSQLALPEAPVTTTVWWGSGEVQTNYPLDLLLPRPDGPCEMGFCQDGRLVWRRNK